MFDHLIMQKTAVTKLYEYTGNLPLPISLPASVQIIVGC